MTQAPRAVAETLDDLYEEAPCGLLSLLPDGEIVRVNRTLLSWTGYNAEELRAGKRFPALLTPPGALLYETHCLPLLRMRGSIGEIALDLQCRDGTRLPILLSAVARRDPSGAPCLFRVVILNAPKRREYERELLVARTQAEEAAAELRIQRAVAERKAAEQDALLQAMGRMADGDLETPILIGPESVLVSLASGLDRMRQEILGQIRDMKERNTEILHLNTELRHQIEQRSRFLLDSMQSAMSTSPASAADNSSVEVRPLLPRGTLLANRYRVEATLGQGAMGTVYEVERTSDGRRFAAKVLSANPDSRTMARFAREALLLARLQHPNLIAIVDLDINSDRVACLVMELVDGKSLAELGARYGDHDFMLPVLRQVADALTTVHSAGIVHRDLKPANVLISVSADGTQATARLADFGISRLLEIVQAAPDTASPARVEAITDPPAARLGKLDAASDDPARTAFIAAVSEVPAMSEANETIDVRVRRPLVAPPLDASPGASSGRPAAASNGENRRGRPSDSLTQVGALVGTLPYMAPELLGGANLAQPPSDIFSFGLMAHEVLTGTLPFEEPPLLMAARGYSAPRLEPLDTLCRGLSPALARLLERCLDNDPASRPTAVELSGALGKIQIAH
jgi:PAS domain S-box-containing protein